MCKAIWLSKKAWSSGPRESNYSSATTTKNWKKIESTANSHFWRNSAPKYLSYTTTL